MSVERADALRAVARLFDTKRRQMPFLESQGEVREIDSGELLVGSGTQAGWRIPSADLAARHFAVVAGAAGTHLRPLSTQHLVVVNGRAVGEPVALSDGDVIAAGTARFLFLERAEGRRPDGWDSPQREAFLVDERERQAYPLDRRAVTIGRDAASRVLLRDPTVSRFHADVRREAGQYVLYSMGSAGTQVNGRRAAGAQLLEEGDRIAIGDSTLLFTYTAPQGMTLVRGGDESEDSSSKRDTVLHQRAVSFDDDAGDGRKRIRLVAIVVVIVAVALVFWLL